jgi:hypothetical protein
VQISLPQEPREIGLLLYPVFGRELRVILRRVAKHNRVAAWHENQNSEWPLLAHAGHDGNPMRRMRSWNRLSDRRGSKAGRTRMEGLKCCWYAFSNQVMASVLRPGALME